MSKFITVNLAQGLDKSTDPRIAPNGALTRVQNLRVDQRGRMALRNGYQSLGVTVHEAGTQLVPFDLKEFNGDLVCLGNHSPANQTGIRAVYVYEPYAPAGNWRTAGDSPTINLQNNTASFIGLSPADSPRILYSDSHANADSNRAVADIAATGNFICVVSQQLEGASSVTAVEVLDASTGNLVAQQLISGTNPRVIAVGTTFVLFVNSGTSLLAFTFNTLSSTNFPASTVVGGLGVADGAYDVALFEGTTTEYLLVVSTATGYTWTRRLLSTHAIQANASIVSLANAPVSICGASGETINVVNVRAVNGFELRTFAVTGGAPTLGPTNLDVLPAVFTWVGICRFSSTQVYVIGSQTSSFPNLVTTTGAHVVTRQTFLADGFIRTKPIMVDGVPFAWAVLSSDTRRPYALFALGIDGFAQNPNMEMAAVALNGQAKPDYAAIPASHFVPHIARGPGKKLLAALPAKDTRDNSFRVHVVETEVFTGARRQMTAIGQTLYIAGGTLAQFDGGTAPEVGFEVSPRPGVTFFQSSTGSMTLLGVYTFVLVFRSVSRSGQVTQSAPSAPFTVTLTGANNAVQFVVTGVYSRRITRIARAGLLSVFCDVYRTEANGSIPRYSQSVEVTASVVAIGSGGNVAETNSDAVVQAGAKLYTQGESGSISGRLPLALPSACRNLAVTEGKLWLGGLERRTEYQLSVENRPGEAAGFVNDDLFFGEANEDITALAVATDGKRYLFSGTQIREVRGEGPNAAGIGELSEPLPVDSPVGCNDWRSVVSCEHGVFFRASDSKIYLLPKGGGSAIEASEGIRDILEQFPVTTGAVRTEADQHVTFTLANAAGTDGRIVHLDLQTSGFDSRTGWRATWIVDRCTLFEDVPDIVVLSDTLQTFEGLPATVTVQLPAYNQSGDRFYVIFGGSGTGSSFGTPAGWTAVAAPALGSGYIEVLERILTGAAVTSVAIAPTNPAGTVVRVLHLRGCHASTPAERVTATAPANTALNLAVLTPTWGSAKNLWVAACCSTAASGVTPPGFASPIFNGFPGGFASFHADSVLGAGLLGCELATCRVSLISASLDPSAFTTRGAVDLLGILFAVRPAGTAGTPIRAPEQFGGRLVVCSSTDVLLATAGNFADQGGLFIVAECETPTIYGMGPGGAARHKGIVFIGEFRGRCVLGCELSYDDGMSYTELAAFTLNAGTGYTAGQTVKIQWVPRRRKVEGVRARFRVTEDTGTGPSEGLVFNQAIFEFEDIVGPARLPSASRR